MSYTSRSNRFRKRKKVNLRKVGTMVTLVLFVVLVFACIRYFSLFNMLSGSDSPTIWRPDSTERVQLLLIGRGDESIISSTLLSIPSGREEPVYILKIPPQALLAGPDIENTDTLAQVFSDSGVEAGIQAVNQLLEHKLPIDNYVLYDVQGVQEIVSALEGIEIELPSGFQVHHQDTDYVFAPGLNTIDSNNMVPLIASGTSMDLVAFWAEKSLLVEVFNQLFSLKHISYVVTNLGQVSETYETDMTSRELARFRDTLQALEWDNTNFLALPGRWLSSQEERFWSTEQRLVNLTVLQILEGVLPYDREALIIDVFNGNGVNGFAGKTATELRDQEFKIGLVDNAEEVAISEIYYTAEYKLAALELAIILDVEAVLIEDTYQNSENPVTIILGRDLVGGN